MARTPENTPQDESSTWLLIRGMIRGCFHWHHFPEKLQQQFPNDRVICLDIPGNGALFSQTTPASINNISKHLAEQLKVHNLSTSKINIIAISMGGMIACELLANHITRERVASLHLINTSFANLSLPWQRMKARAFFSLLSKVIKPELRERAILSWTSNQAVSADRVDSWLQEATRHPVKFSSALAQVLAAGRYPAPDHPPLANSFIYCSKHDRLVSPECSKKLADHWGLPVIWHDTAGHDLPLDDPDWLVAQIATAANS